MGTKICRTCHKEKSIGEFYKHSEMADGHLNICKDCTKIRVTKHRNNNLDRIRKYDNGRPRRSYTTKKYKKDFPKRRDVHCKTDSALKRGMIKKQNQCEDCGTTKKRVVKHHDDYSQPFEVRWLCDVCHHKWHKANGAGVNG